MVFVLGDWDSQGSSRERERLGGSWGSRRLCRDTESRALENQGQSLWKVCGRAKGRFTSKCIQGILDANLCLCVEWMSEWLSSDAAGLIELCWQQSPPYVCVQFLPSYFTVKLLSVDHGARCPGLNFSSTLPSSVTLGKLLHLFGSQSFINKVRTTACLPAAIMKIKYVTIYKVLRQHLLYSKRSTNVGYS